ncbi:integrase [Aurantimicrobium minutum]|uniref:site-specific integrase n=1 Tax=Aurantimicrobium minutum TaxID=708131 RepID=UPI002475E5E8|nr:site-specific integrase [Aurantimicrobium minutum]MDH6532263.1 integrase [Aurantimicrobium minutum]
MPSIHEYKLSDGSKAYFVSYRKPDHSQAKKRGFKTKRDANEFIASTTVSKATGTFIDASETKASVESLGTVWLANKATVVKPSTFHPLEVAWRLHVQPVWGKRAVGSIRHTEIQTWVTKLSSDLGATSVIRAYGILSGILENSVKDRRISANPAKDVRLPRKTAKAHAYLTHNQAEELATAAGEYSTVVHLLTYTGLRWGEATALRVKHLDLLKLRLTVTENAVDVGGTIHVGTPKSHEARTVPIPRFLATELAKACEGKSRNALVLGDGVNHLRRPSTGKGWLDSAVRQCQATDPNFPRVTPHDLRHTAASLSVSAGANVKVVQRMLGHASAAMTLDIYADLFDADLDSVSEALDSARTAASVAKLLPQAL